MRKKGLYLDSNKILEAFLNSGKTKQQIAEEVGCTSPYISCLMNLNYTTKNTVSVDYAARVAKALNVTVSSLKQTTRKANIKKDEWSQNFGELIDGWLNYSGISQNDLSRKTGLVPDVIRKLRRGETSMPRLETIQKLANAFGVTYGVFMAGVPAVETDNALKEPAVADKQNKEQIKQNLEVQKQDVKDEYLRNIPVWLYVLLEEEIMDAHKGFRESTKAADKKCYASIVEMHSRFFVKGNMEQ